MVEEKKFIEKYIIGDTPCVLAEGQIPCAF